MKVVLEVSHVIVLVDEHELLVHSFDLVLQSFGPLQFLSKVTAQWLRCSLLWSRKLEFMLRFTDSQLYRLEVVHLLAESFAMSRCTIRHL